MVMYLPIIIALVLYFTGIPIAYALLAGTLYYFGFVDTTSKTYLLLQKFITATQSFPLLAIPFFIMAGSIMNYSGMSDKLMAFADALTGHSEGGLAQMNVLLSMLMGGCSGSANADAAMECKMLVPEMEKRGYGKGFSAAITAASSCITPIIPPGINLIVYGLIAGASVGKLFAADLTDTRIVQSSASGFGQHNVITWGIDHGKPAYAEENDPTSLWVNSTVDSWLADISQEDRVVLVNDLFDALAAGGAEHLDEFDDGGLAGVEKIVRRMRDSSDTTRKLIKDLPKQAFKQSIQNLKEKIRGEEKEPEAAPAPSEA